MKEIRLPKEISLRIFPAGSSPKAPASNVNDVSVIEKNGLEVITAAVLLESRMIEAVAKLLFGNALQDRTKREFFVEEIMGTSDFSFAFKRRAFTRLLERTQALEAEATKELKAGLNKVMEWRNAFAHGRLVLEHGGGFVLEYYSGGRKELVMDNAFFENVEDTIRNCLYKCNSIINSA